MFIKERDWIQEGISSLELFRPPIKVLDIGSSTKQYRTEKQPYLGELYQSLIKKGFSISTLDMDPQTNADFILDISDENFPNIGKFDIVLACNILEHIRREKFQTAINNIKKLTSGILIVTTPLFYPWHFHPIDNSLRPTPEEISGFFGSDFKILRADSWEDEHYLQRYSSNPKPWVSGVIMKKINN
jgi:SAM-dependent methyltransferase